GEEEPQEPEAGREGDDHLSRQRQRRAAGGHEDRGREDALHDPPEHEARPEVDPRPAGAGLAWPGASGAVILEVAMKRAVLAVLAVPFVLPRAARADEGCPERGGQ